MAQTKRDPKTKAEVLNRMFSFDFDGDIRHLGDQTATLSRTAANKAQLTFPTSGQTFEIVIRRPREFSKAAKSGAPTASEKSETEAPGARNKRTPPPTRRKKR